MMNQLTLGISLQDDATFANYFTGRNETLVNFLQDFSQSSTERMIYLWGSPGAGLSHILQACCHHVTQQGHACLYLPLNQANDLAPQILHGLDVLKLIVIDDIDAIVAQKDWEDELFFFFNRILQQVNTHVIFAGHFAAKQLPLSLPDLQSRLNSLISFHVQALEDNEKIAVLQMRAKARGIQIANEVGKFLLNRCSRNMSSLFHILDRLDQASLVAQRKLTIPFVKSILRI